MCKKTIYLSFICLFVISPFVNGVDLPYKEGELLVKFAPKFDCSKTTISERNDILSYYNTGQVKDSYKLVSGLTLVKLPDNLKVADALLKLREKSEILYVEPNYKIKLASTFPDDTYFDDLWAIHNTGQTGGTSDADIDAPEAWDIKTDANQIIVAVIDTGVDYNHPDLSENMWVNEAELNGIPEYDDDENGYEDDIYGYDFIQQSAERMM